MYFFSVPKSLQDQPPGLRNQLMDPERQACEPTIVCTVGGVTGI